MPVFTIELSCKRWSRRSHSRDRSMRRNIRSRSLWCTTSISCRRRRSTRCVARWSATCRPVVSYCAARRPARWSTHCSRAVWCCACRRRHERRSCASWSVSRNERQSTCRHRSPLRSLAHLSETFGIVYWFGIWYCFVSKFCCCFSVVRYWCLKRWKFVIIRSPTLINQNYPIGNSMQNLQWETLSIFVLSFWYLINFCLDIYKELPKIS